ncbi:MAG: hypothetical protein KIT73_01240 [Burkholderiales bacterium]|nr:hypothetical protein [Burkholderiales bacterium]
MADERVEEVLRRQAAMESKRSPFETQWREIDERMGTTGSGFGSQSQPGQKQTALLFDSTAPLAAERFTAVMESLITPRHQRWQGLQAAEESLREDDEVVEYFDAVTRLLFRVRYHPRANFAGQWSENYGSLGYYGTGAVFIDEKMGRGLRYRAIYLGELFIEENDDGLIDTVHRRFKKTARQAAQAFGEAALPEKIRVAAGKEPEKEFEFIHCVRPADEVKHRRADYAGMQFASWYIAVEGKHFVREGGYRTFPYAISRYVTTPRSVYGKSPAMTALPEIKTVNQIRKDMLMAGQMGLLPPLLLQEDGALEPFQMRPGALNYGALDANGNPLVQPLKVSGDMGWGESQLQEGRKVINDVFLVTLFQILIENPRMTATEALLRAQEKGALLAPTAGRQESEALGPLIERELDLLAMAGQLPPMPRKLMDAGGLHEITYDNPMSRMVQSEEAVGTLRSFEQLTPFANINPEVMDIFDPDETGRIVTRVNGVPGKAIRSREQVAAVREARKASQSQQSMLDAAPVAASAAKDLAQAQALMRAQPAVIPGQL